MPQFIVMYQGGDHPESPEERQQHFAKYMDWIKGLGSAAIQPMNPMKNTHHINSQGGVSAGSQLALTGFTVLQADNIDAAIDMCRDCPFLAINGQLEVSELVDMSNG